MTFPHNFTWGVAAAAYQIEGGWDADGRAPSVWDAFSQVPGNTFENNTGDRSCDHYHRYKEDVALMANLGVSAYRLSVSWSRVLPDAFGKPNQAGLDFYDRLFDELLAANIQPWVTLFHWDEPLAMYERGGWINPECVEWFGEYATLLAERYSDRVTHWMTLNEPQCFIGFGHATGYHAPGPIRPRRDVLAATHNVLKAHGKAVQAIRAASTPATHIGWAPVGVTFIPDSDSPEDVEQARRYMFDFPPPTCDMTSQYYFNNAWYSDPVILGHYPKGGEAYFGKDMPRIKDADMELISQPIDFYGVNIYFGSARVRANMDPNDLNFRELGMPRTMTGWPVTPEALYWGPKLIAERYNLPIYITENGTAGMDWIHSDGKVNDHHRIDFLTRYLRQLKRAIDQGIDIRGYFQWSIMDNLEWSEGYSKRFGLVYVDFETLQRLPKESFHFYKQIIQSNGELLSTIKDEHPGLYAGLTQRP